MKFLKFWPRRVGKTAQKEQVLKNDLLRHGTTKTVDEDFHRLGKSGMKLRRSDGK